MAVSYNTRAFMEQIESEAVASLDRDIQNLQDAMMGLNHRAPHGLIINADSINDFAHEWTSIMSGQQRFPSGGVMGKGSALGFWDLDREETPATAAEIHAALDAAADKAEQEARRVLEYRQMYPSNPFLTRDQVKALCLKYNLVMAPDFMFTAQIPEKNQAERASFQLHENHKMCNLDESEIARLMMRGAVDASRHRGIVFDPVMPIPEDTRAPWLMVLSGDFALYCPEGLDALRRWMLANFGGDRAMYSPDFYKGIPAIPIVRTKAGFVRLRSGMIRPEHLNIERQEPDSFLAGTLWGRFATPVTTVRFRFSMPEWYRSECLYTDDVSQMVVCPANMLSQNMNIDLKENWEATFSPRERNPSGRGADPIILQPVDGGYLVVTKWDAEARLPEVAGQTN